jgi:hypothetical protein
MMHPTDFHNAAVQGIDGFGSFTQSAKYESIDSRMSAMMEASPFGETNLSDRYQAEKERKSRLQALVNEGVLRPSDVFMTSGKSHFLSTLVPGTLSYFRRVRENSYLFKEYQACSNESDQQRIVQEIVESVWLNEGRFLVIDKDTNSVVVVADHKLPSMIVADLLSRENAFPALWGNKAKSATSHANKKKTTLLSKERAHNRILEKALSSGRHRNINTDMDANNGNNVSAGDRKKKNGGLPNPRGRKPFRGSRHGRSKSHRYNNINNINNGNDTIMS